MQMFWNDSLIQCQEVFRLDNYITSQIVFPTKQVRTFIQSIIRYYAETDSFCQFRSSFWCCCTQRARYSLGDGEQGPREGEGKLMWPATVPFAHVAALWTPHFIYMRLSLLGLLAMALVSPSTPTTLTGQRQDLSGKICCLTRMSQAFH